MNCEVTVPVFWLYCAGIFALLFFVGALVGYYFEDFWDFMRWLREERKRTD